MAAARKSVNYVVKNWEIAPREDSPTHPNTTASLWVPQFETRGTWDPWHDLSNELATWQIQNHASGRTNPVDRWRVACRCRSCAFVRQFPATSERAAGHGAAAVTITITTTATVAATATAITAFARGIVGEHII